MHFLFTLTVSSFLLSFQDVTKAEFIRDHDQGGISPIEEEFLQIPSAEAARSNLFTLTREPHVAGTPGDRNLAEFVAEEFRQAGIPDVSIFDLEVRLNYPDFCNPPQLILKKARESSENNQEDDIVYKAKLSEEILDVDETSDTIWRNRTFHGFSPAGRIQPGVPLVYANYGRPTDFEALEQAGVSVNGTVVLIRYGKCFRGLKVQNAQERGALGVLIYSDPADDGYGQPGGVYPDGPWRPPSGVQRGSVQFNSRCAGDPFRADPRYPQDDPVQELCGVQSSRDLIPSIPSLPISYEDATPLLQNMDGPLAHDVGGKEFCGGISNVTYRVGPSSQVVVELFVYNTDLLPRKIPNVVGVIPGQLPASLDMPVLLGNHRDAWVYGAADPNSGTAALLEVAKGLGKLYEEEGWRPLRTIYLLSWSGEEYGLLGSTGWGELNQDQISRALVYLNVDTVVSGDILKASASPSLTSLWLQVLSDLNNQTIIKSQGRISSINAPIGHLHDANTDWPWKPRLSGGTGQSPLHLENVGILGSGSDYTVFLDHLGIPSLDFSFSKRSTYGQYHSVYDSFAWVQNFGGHDGEPESAFDLIALGARIWGILAMRLAGTTLVPLNQIIQGEAIKSYVEAIEAQEMKLDLRSLKAAVESFQEAAARLHLRCLGAKPNPSVDVCNERLALVERKFLLPKGLPGRPWFKHVLQAPGVHLGYSAEAFPSIQQALDEGDSWAAQAEVQKVANLIKDAADFMIAD